MLTSKLNPGTVYLITLESLDSKYYCKLKLKSDKPFEVACDLLRFANDQAFRQGYTLDIDYRIRVYDNFKNVYRDSVVKHNADYAKLYLEVNGSPTTPIEERTYKDLLYECSSEFVDMTMQIARDLWLKKGN